MCCSISSTEDKALKSHITVNLVEMSCDRLDDVQGALRGLSGLLTQGTSNPSLNGSEYYGLGQLLSNLSEEVEKSVALLRDGDETVIKSRLGQQ